MTQFKPLHIGIIAGELSGDLLAAGLIRELRQQYPGEIKFTGIGGDAMREQGVNTHADISALSIIGLDGLFSALPNIIKIRRKIFDIFTNEKIDLFIGVDAPDFNIYFETKLAKAGIKCVHYVSPTIWAWRYGRIHRIKKSVEHVVCLFPFEKKLYEKEGVPATFIGHPMADEITSQVRDKNKIRANLSLDKDAVVIALLPGSRRKEVARMTEVMLETAAKVAKQSNKNVQFVFSVSREDFKSGVVDSINKHGLADIVFPVVGGARDVIAASDFAIAASGTVTLECMFLNKPMIVIYIGAPISAILARMFIKLELFALPNLLSSNPLIPEFFQGDATSDNISLEMINLMNNVALQKDMKQDFHEITNQLTRNAHYQGGQTLIKIINEIT